MKEGSLMKLIALSLIGGVGNARLLYMLNRFTRADAVFSLDDSEIISELDKVRGGKIKDFSREELFEKADRIIEDSKKRGIDIITIEDERYPFNLKQLENPPVVLYSMGDINALQKNAVAIVGTREPTEDSKRFAFDLAAELAAMGIWVVSGLARGVDTGAHWGALSVSCNTAGVLGCGLDHVYPAENQRLYDKIVSKGGVLLSEFATGRAPERENFPRRNRVISGLSYAVVVVQAGKRSGALITAKNALEQGRDVYVAPYDERNPAFFGNHRYAREGAAIVHSAQDIIDDIGAVFASTEAEAARAAIEQGDLFESMPKADVGHDDGAQAAHEPLKDVKTAQVPTELSEDEEKVISFMETEVHIDDLYERSGIDMAELSAILMKMEIKGLVKQKPGKVFVKSF